MSCISCAPTAFLPHSTPPAGRPRAALLTAADEPLGVMARLGRLDERSRRVVELRFGLGGEDPMTLREVGERLGLSRDGVRAIEKQAIARLGEGGAAVPA